MADLNHIYGTGLPRVETTISDTGEIKQYYSKWRLEWVNFPTTPGPGEITTMLKYYYQLR